MKIGLPSSRASARPAAARTAGESRRTLSRKFPVSSATSCRLAIDRLHKQHRSGNRALGACWLPHFAATNFSFYVTCQPIEAIAKLVKAEYRDGSRRGDRSRGSL